MSVNGKSRSNDDLLREYCALQRETVSPLRDRILERMKVGTAFAQEKPQGKNKADHQRIRIEQGGAKIATHTLMDGIKPFHYLLRIILREQLVMLHQPENHRLPTRLAIQRQIDSFVELLGQELSRMNARVKHHKNTEPPAAEDHEKLEAAKVLGCRPDDTPEEIARVYKKKSRQHHPDHGGSNESQSVINEAYRRLTSGQA